MSNIAITRLFGSIIVGVGSLLGGNQLIGADLNPKAGQAVGTILKRVHGGRTYADWLRDLQTPAIDSLDSVGVNRRFRKAVSAVKEIGGQVLPAVLQMLWSEDYDERMRAELAFYALGKEANSCVPELRKAMVGENANVSLSAASPNISRWGQEKSEVRGRNRYG
jgi:hypothetical protein